VAGLIIFPACATFNVAVDSGPGLIFEALPKVFAAMEGGRIWGALFFLFLTLGALTTIIAVFECIIGGLCDELCLKRPRVAVLVGMVVMAGSLPTILFPGVLEMEDFIFSQFCLPLGALTVCVFVSRQFGWGFSNFRREASSGRGPSLPNGMAVFFRWIIPVLIALIVIGGAIM
jgi:NSS family neurotransmitter:Na+ symporter